MRRMSKPPLVASDVFDSCVATVGDAASRTRLQAIAPMTTRAAAHYEQLAVNQGLYCIPHQTYQPDDVVTGAVTRKDFNDLYELQMVAKSKPSRRYYDELIARAPAKKCPYCGFGQARTLDHYLPKAKFPSYSVLPENLVPACRDCQSCKSAKVAVAAGEQTLHPYFDPNFFFTERWLHARVVAEAEPAIEFFVACPEGWAADAISRVQNHFDAYELGSRYAIEAGEELTNIGAMLSVHPQKDVASIKAELHAQALVEQSLFPNSWKTALYEALSVNDWYCGGGFRV